MLARIQKWGNSQGVRLPKMALRRANLQVGDEVEVIAKDRQILVRQAEPVRGRYRLEDLVARIPKGYRPKEENWGRPVGREVW